MVRRRPAHRARRRVRHQARPRPRRARLVGRDLLRARGRAGATTCGDDTDPAAIGVRALDDRTVEFRLAAPGAVLHERDEPARRRPAAARTRSRPPATPGPTRPRRSCRARSGSPSATPDRAGARAPATGGRRDRERRARRVLDSAARVRRARALRRRDELDLVAVRYTPRLADLVPARRCPTCGSARRRGPATSPSTTTTRCTATCELRRALAHAVDREALGARPAREHGPGDGRHRAARAAGPHARHRAAVRPRPARGRSCASRGRREARASRASRTTRPVHRAVLASWRDVLGIDVRARDVDRARSSPTMPPAERARADLLHGLAPGLRGPRVLPAAAVPVGQQDERGRVRTRRRSTT